MNVMDHEGLVRKIAKKFLPNASMSKEDIVQAGFVGLMKAAKNYDPTVGAFSTYAYYKIKYTILDALNQQYGAKKWKDHPKLEMLIEEAVASPEQPATIGSATSSSNWLNILSRRYAHILYERYYNGATSYELADMYGISQPAMCVRIKFARKLVEMLLEDGDLFVDDNHIYVRRVR